MAQNSMRRLVADIQKSSNQGGRKVGIVFEADRMHAESANAFLKTLEEPQPAPPSFYSPPTPTTYSTPSAVAASTSVSRPHRIPSTPIQTGSDGAKSYRAWLSLLIQGAQ